jgi:hypothetical protein
VKDGKSNLQIGTISFDKKLAGKRTAGKPHGTIDEAGDGNGVITTAPLPDPTW